MTSSLFFKVRGVTFEGRQEIIAKMIGDEPARIVAEPTNLYDANALAIHVATKDGVKHIGYVPKENAAKFAPYLDGEPLTGYVIAITGGFLKADGSVVSYGVDVCFDMPDDFQPADLSAGWEP
jgi:hypothetical protein